MRSVCKTTIISSILLFVVISNSFAQFKTSPYEIGISAGTLAYQGDLSINYLRDYKSLKPSVGVFVSRDLATYFSLRANLAIGKVAIDESKHASPSWKKYRLFKFETPVTELAALLVFNPYGNQSARKLTPYLFGGAGVTFLNIKRDWRNYNSAVYNVRSRVQTGLAIDTIQSLPGVIPVLPLGGGLRLALSPQLSLNGEMNYRLSATDYFDGFKYSANPQKSDAYYSFLVGIIYRFDNYKCPPVR